MQLLSVSFSDNEKIKGYLSLILATISSLSVCVIRTESFHKYDVEIFLTDDSKEAFTGSQNTILDSLNRLDNQSYENILSSRFTEDENSDRLFERLESNVSLCLIPLNVFSGSNYFICFGHNFSNEFTPTEKLVISAFLENIEAVINKVFVIDRFGMYFYSSPDAINIISLPDGVFIEVNENYIQETGFSRDELIGKCIHNFGFWADEKDYKLFSERVKKHGEVKNWKATLRNKNGEKRISLLSSRISNIDGVLVLITIARNIDDIAKSERIIARSEERYRTIVELSYSAIFILTKDGIVDYCNLKALELIGMTMEETIGTYIGKMIHSDSLEKTLDRFNGTVGGDVQKGSFEFQLLSQDNNLIDIEVRSSTFTDIDGKFKVISQLVDLTEKKKAVNDLRKAKEKAEESDRLKSAFLANMSHEIRTPLNSIIGFSGLIEDNEVSEDEAKFFIKRIKFNGEALLNLINDIIDISKIEANQVTFHFEDINVDNLFEQLVATLSVLGNEKSINLVYKIPKGIDAINLYSDINRLNQVLLNLISNAIKFTSKNGKIEIGCYVKENNLEFYVSDDGIGIDKSEQDDVFNRFEQAKIISQTNLGGTGLGLSISKGLVEKMGGQIWLESELGKGSIFYFKLPIIKNLRKKQFSLF